MASLAPNPHVHTMDHWDSPLKAMMESCAAHDHICLIYETQEEQLAAVVPFLRIGLERGEKCLYIVDENTPETITAALKQDGVDTDAAIASGALSILDPKDTYLDGGDFDPNGMIVRLKDAIDAAEAQGFTAFRVSGETTWALRPPKNLDPLIEYECRLNDFFQHQNLVAICQYDRRRFRPEALLHVIRTHPFVVCGDLVCENPHYIPPGIFGPNKYDPAAEVERLLVSITENAQLKRELAAEAEQAHLLSAETTRWRQLYEAVLANTPDLGCMFDLDHRFTYANGALLALLGRKWDDVVGKTASEIGFEPSHAALHDREIARVIATRGPVRGEFPFRGADGLRTYDYIFYPVIGPTGEVEAVGAATRDISDLKEVENALRESEERFRTIVDTTPECVKLVSREGTLLHINPSGLAMVGAQSAEEVIGTSIYDAIAPEQREAFRAFNERVCGGEKGFLRFDIVGLDGVRRHMESHAAPLRTPEGKTVQLALTRDITERMRAKNRCAGASGGWKQSLPICAGCRASVRK